MVDGLHRWNEDRAWAATSTANDYQPYSGLLRHTANVLGLQVLKRKVDPTFTEPRKYTGTLFCKENTNKKKNNRENSLYDFTDAKRIPSV